MRALPSLSSLLFSSALLLLFAGGDGCQESLALGPAGGPELLYDTAAGDELPAGELEARERMATTPIAITGAVWDELGRPLAGAVVELDEGNVATDATGIFHVTDLLRVNRLVRFSAPGYRDALRAVHLSRSVEVTEVRLAPVVLVERAPDRARFSFAGDTAFGRRFLDSDGSTPRGLVPPDDPAALISTAAPEPGTRGALQYVRPLLLEPDVAVVNLETPVTAAPDTPHLTKPFAFFTLPESLPALQWAGVDYVSLGNNHVYDYLEAGLEDTVAALDASGLPHSGAGPDPQTAFTPHDLTVAGTDYSLLSMTSIAGRQHELTYVAESDATGTKGGAADLTDTSRVHQAIADARARGRLPIAQLHQGSEYVEEHSPFVLGRIDDIVSAGAGLIVSHHPHVLGGFGWHDGVLAAYGLGNFAFDQDRLETMIGLMAHVDFEQGEVVSTTGIPLYLEDYRPRPIAGRLAERMVRRVARLSPGTRVGSENGTARVHRRGIPWATLERQLATTVDVPASGWATIDLRRLLEPGESLVGGHLDAPGATVRAGQDLLLFGDIEDYDVDAVHLEAERWDLSADSRFTCVDGALDAAALCSVRSSSNRSASTISLRNRVRLEGDATDEPNKDVSLLARLRGRNAGPVRIRTQYRASAGGRDFGEEAAIEHPGGSFPWQALAVDLDIPADEVPGSSTANARAIRLFIDHEPPPSGGDGLLQIDDVALVSWGPPQPADGFALDAPTEREFLRIEAAPGRHSVDLRLQRSHRGLTCTPDATTLCIGSRFRLQTTWQDFDGGTGVGRARPLTNDTGAFWFFDPDNLEIVVKVLDGTSVNGSSWVFFGALSDAAFQLVVTDLWSGRVRVYRNPARALASRGDTEAFAGTVVEAPSLGKAPSASPVGAATDRLLLGEGRFELSLSWKDFTAATGTARAVSLTDDTGYFWFFDGDNVEVVAKILDGRPINGHFWLFFGSLTNVEYTLTVVDRVTGATREYVNPLGRFSSQSDVQAFADSSASDTLRGSPHGSPLSEQ